MKLLKLVSIIILPSAAVYPCITARTFVCTEYLSPVVIDYKYYPDSISFIGVASREIRADYTISSVSAGRIRSAAIDSSSDELQQGLSLAFSNGAIILKGKTLQSGNRNLRMILIRDDSTMVQIRLKVTIKSNEECISSDF